jgi:hypothetical protein
MELDVNQSLRGAMPVTNRLSYGTAKVGVIEMFCEDGRWTQLAEDRIQGFW